MDFDSHRNTGKVTEMSVEMLKLVGINKMTCKIQKVEAEGHIDLEFKMYDRNNHCNFLYIDRSQAHLMM